MAELARQKELTGGQERDRLHRKTRNGAWISAVPHRLNSTEFSWEELRDNICLRYGLMPQDIPATCDGCGKRFSINHSLSCPKGGIVMARHNDSANEWGALGSRALVPSAITYKPKINSRTVKGERTGARERQEGGIVNGGADIVGEAQGGGGSGPTVNRAAVLARSLGQVAVPAESRADVSAHRFWKWGTTAVFDIRIANLDTVSYLHMTPEKSLYKGG